jgi:hypothetical protein
MINQRNQRYAIKMNPRTFCFAIMGLVLIHLAFPSRANSGPEGIPRMVRITPDILRCDRECVIGNISISGSGFAVGQTVSISQGKLLEARLISDSQLLLTIGFDQTAYSPGWVRVTVSTRDHSTSGNMAFLGNTNAAARLGSECFYLDQGNAMVWVFDCGVATRNPGTVLVPRRGCFVGASFAGGIAADDKTGLIVIAKQYGILVMRPENCETVNVIGLPTTPASAARGQSQ